MATMAEKSIKIAPKSDAAIKSKVSRKLNHKSRVIGNPIADILSSIAAMALIIPCLIYGTFIFIGTGFRCGMEAAIKMYDDGMKGAKGWAR